MESGSTTNQSRHRRSLVQRIDDGKEWEAVEISVPGANLADAVCLHQNRGVEVMHDTAAHFRRIFHSR